MGLLDSIIGSVLGNSAGSGNLSSIVGSILGGQAQSGGGGLNLPNLINQFERAGMGQVIGSWIGNGPNQPVDPQSLNNVFGHQQVSQWAQQTGMSHDGILDSLSKILPHAVDQSTPSGQVEQGLPGSSPFDAPGLELPPGR